MEEHPKSELWIDDRQWRSLLSKEPIQIMDDILIHPQSILYIEESPRTTGDVIGETETYILRLDGTHEHSNI